MQEQTMKYGHVAPDSMKARGMFEQASQDVT